MASWRLKHPSTLAAIYALNGNALDGTGRYPGTLVNTPTWATFLTGRGCIELDGNDQHVNCGDVAELNNATSLTICFWMNQDVLDQVDTICHKTLDATHSIRIATWNTGLLYCFLGDGADSRAQFDYSTVVSAASWHHFAMIFDGAQAANATRLVVYVDGLPITLGFADTIPAAAPDLSGQDAFIGRDASTFDGRLYDFRIYSVPLSRDEIISIIHEAVPV